MFLQTLDLTDYRNYEALHLDLGAGRFILGGDNAQGKSNLCEAIRMLATMRSFRASSDRELVRWKAPGHFARIAASISRNAESIQLEIIISAPPETGEQPTESMIENIPMPATLARGGKRVRVNGSPRRALDCVGLFTAVLFEPADLDLVIGAPSGRRHFMDVTLCQISRSYCRTLSQYQKVVAQRSALLKRIRDNLDDPRALEYWDEQITALAIPLISERAGLIARCTPPADEVARRMGARGLQVIYEPSFPVDIDMPSEDARDAFREQLARLRRREIAQGINLLGPHRDDIAFMDGTINLATYGSRGQQRIAALALKLAELEAIELETGEQPILVLDDVLSELDPHRRAALVSSVAEISQVILTTAEPDALPASFVEGAQRFAVTEGKIERLQIV
jgi:DNA replication and repair protein RecF